MGNSNVATLGGGRFSSFYTTSHSSFSDDDDDDDCRCFGWGAPRSSVSKSRPSSIGTPLPDTPVRRSYQPPPSKKSEKASESAAPEFFSQYSLHEVLGVGSTSTCHRCVCRSTGVAYACKIIDKAHVEARYAGMLEQFSVEIATLRGLRHPHIIRLRDVYSDPRKIFMVMELMEGGELFDYVVKKKTLSEHEAAAIVRMVASAVAYMHSQDVIHRDLKPENLLLARKADPGDDQVPEVKIIDFGLSKHLPPVSGTSPAAARSFLGTRGYLAPEMLLRRAYARTVDVWALGIIVFVLLCGCLPFDDRAKAVPDEGELRRRFALRFPRWANNLSGDARDLLRKLLDVNPQTRATAAQALDHPWVRGVSAPRDRLLKSPKRLRTPVLNQQRNQRGGGHTYQPPTYQPQAPPHVYEFTKKTERPVPQAQARGGLGTLGTARYPTQKECSSSEEEDAERKGEKKPNRWRKTSL